MAEKLAVKCKNCGEEFIAGIQFDRASFADPSNRIGRGTEQCRHCGSSASYEKADYHFVEVRP